MADFPESHVLLNAVHSILELNARHIYIRDHRADVA